MPDNRPDFNEYANWSTNTRGRGGTKIDLFLLHTQEGDGNADDLAKFLRSTEGTDDPRSYHYTVSQAPDNGVTVVDVVDTDVSAFAVGNSNDRSINLCFAGSKAGWSRAQWLQQSRAIDVAAYLAVQDCKKYGIAISVIAPPYPLNPPGISDHRYCTQHLRDGNSHTDVGDNFPWDVFANAVAKYRSGVPAAPPQFQRPSQDQMIAEIWDQLRGPEGKGWPQLGGKTLVDAVADLRKP